LAADGVVVTGFVPDIVDELRHADIVAVPIFYGGGTRIKILEAFAHRIPVVSTLAGAEGLDVGDKEHLLIADSPEAFADACRCLLENLGLRAHLADRAHEHFRARFEWSALRGRIQDFSRRVMDHPGLRP
jgi:glycosyltransferase involved in cell wall biosynthesis